MIRAGDLRERIAIKRLVVTQDDLGSEVTTLEDVATVYAGKFDLSVKDINLSQGSASQAELKFLVRYRTDISTDMQVIHKGTTYYVTGTADATGHNKGTYILVRTTV